MHNAFRFALIVMALALIAAPALAEEPAAAKAYRAAEPVKIDGDLGEWALSNPIVIDNASQVIRDGDLWKGAGDCSVTAYIMWDEANLYLAADVHEDSPFGAIEMLPLDGEDNLKLFISTNPGADPARTAYDTNDFMLYLIMDGQYWDTAFDRTMVGKDLRQRFVSKGMDGGENVLEGYACTAVSTEYGFIYEATIPWAVFSNESIPVYAPKTGDQIKFDLAITDISYPCPGTEYIPQMAWTGDLNINTNPSLWGTLIFE